MSNSLVLLDESGDLGWKFDQPYGAGGSSRYFTLAAAVGTNGAHRKFGAVVKKLAKQQNWSGKKEKKWQDLGSQVRKNFAHLTVEMVRSNSDLHLLVAVIDKRKVPTNIHGHHHLVYSWLAASLLAPSLRTFRHASICPDELNSGSDSLLENVLRKEIWFNLRSQTKIERIQRSEPLEGGLSFCDYLAGTFQSHFEFTDSEPYKVLREAAYLHMPWA
ncbi:hypothetical protein V6582_07980 [Agrobacterium vitis]|uniref:hypothetical protein n=1 Tax=Agrobacterium vitis TaxID=373 RepID=UPI0012E8F4E8|nr:hypothetical protein [Agrobacterium vitis]MVA27528.1 hypothetical protein [Agrobacterium vitis]